MGLRPYEPRFELWADGASKERFVFLQLFMQYTTPANMTVLA